MTTLKPQVRTATAADGTILLSLIDALADYENLERPTASAKERLLRDGFGKNPRFRTLLVEAEGRAAGYAILYDTYSTFLALPTLHIEDIFVLPEFRAQRTGSTLFRHIVRLALEGGYGRVEWSVLHWNTLAKEFYQRMGGWHNDQWQPYRMTIEDMQRCLGNALKP